MLSHRNPCGSLPESHLTSYALLRVYYTYIRVYCVYIMCVCMYIYIYIYIYITCILLLRVAHFALRLARYASRAADVTGDTRIWLRVHLRVSVALQMLRVTYIHLTRHTSCAADVARALTHTR